MESKTALQSRPSNFGKKHSGFSCVCSLAFAAPRVIFMLPHIVVICAVKRIQNAMLLMSNEENRGTFLLVFLLATLFLFLGSTLLYKLFSPHEARRK